MADVNDYVMRKYNLGPYSDENRKRLEDEAELGTADKVSAALAALGAGFQGKDAGAAGMNRLNSLQSQKREPLESFDRGRSNRIQEIGLERDAVKAQREDAQYDQDQQISEREKDPNSQESKLANELAVSMGYKGSPITAAQFKQFSPVMQKRYEIEQNRLNRQESREQRNFERETKREEKLQGLKTPFGLANTEDDAKKVKEGFESKANFDRKIQEMIELRKKYGTEYWNREAVARGKQLSKDLLLEYKNMAKLGVLSQNDENIINAILPEDPLAQDWVAGQDPILSNLEKFKNDSDVDFQNKVATRTRAGVETAADRNKRVVKTQTNAKTGERREVYEDGSFKILPPQTVGGR